MGLASLACYLAPKQGLSLASAHPPSAVSTVAAAVAIPFIAVHVHPSFTAHADASWPSFASSASGYGRHIVRGSLFTDAASPSESEDQVFRDEAVSIIAVFHPKNVITTFFKNVALQVLLTFNQYMIQLLDHEKSALEAEEQGQPVPDPPPIPDFKPSFTKGSWQTGRELVTSVVRKIYQAATVRKLGFERASPFLRDYKNWIKEVLATKHRLDPLSRRFHSYLFAALHGTALFYAADFTVSFSLTLLAAIRRVDKTHSQKAVLVARGGLAQVVVCILRFGSAAVGASAVSLMAPGWASVGNLAFDLGATAAAAPLVFVISGL